MKLQNKNIRNNESTNQIINESINMQTRSKTTKDVTDYTEQRLETDEPSRATLRKFKPIINNLNLFIIKNLKKSRKRSPNQRITLEINSSFQKFLESNYNIGFKYSVCDDFLSDFNLEKERFIKTSSEANCKFFIKSRSFQIKLNRKSCVHYISSGEIPKIIEKNPSISVKLTTTFTSLTFSDEIFLNDYVNNLR